MPPPPNRATDKTVLSPEDAVARFWSSSTIDDAWFEPSFLAKVPRSQVERIRGEMMADVGAFERVEKTASGYRSVFARGSIPTKAAIDDKGRFTALWLGAPEPSVVSVDAAVDRVVAFAGDKGQVSVLVVEDGAERVARNADARLAVGSAFKLAVLAALRAQIDAKKRSLRDVVLLEPRWKSLPSGALHTWPDGTALTLQALATSMISVSDNTATDALLATVGAPAVERLAPNVRPFLSTRQAFVLKSPANADLLAQWRAGDEPAKRALLAAIDSRPLPKADAAPSAGTLDVEWHLSARELCALMAKVQDLPLMSVNPGPADALAWDRVAYKGGSDRGVLNLTTWLVANKKSYCVTATWNDQQELDDTKRVGAYAALLRALRP